MQHGIVEGEPLLDLAYSEDSKAEVDMNIIKTGTGLYIEVQGTAEALPFGREALNRLLDIAIPKDKAEGGTYVVRPGTEARMWYGPGGKNRTAIFE